MAKVLHTFEIPKSVLSVGKKSDTSPYERLMVWAAEKAGGVPKGKTINVSAVLVNEKTEDKLRAVTLKWVRKQMPLSSNTQIERAESYLHLDISPALSSVVKDNHVIVVKKELFVKVLK